MGKSIQFKNKDKEKVYPHPYYPIGSIYLSVNNTNPSTWFDGTWELIAQGRTLVGVDVNDTDFNEAKKTGGEKTHTLTESELPKVKPNVRVTSNTATTGGTDYLYLGGSSAPSIKQPTSGRLGDTSEAFDVIGGDQSHNNMQPFFTCYIWCRVA